MKHRLLHPLLLAACLSSAARADTVACHVSYGGDTQVIRAQPAATPYTVAPIAIGSYFLFRLVFEHQAPGQHAIKVYTYADREPPQGAVLLHQADYLYPPTQNGRYGFTGLQRVYEPIRDGELQYWCGLRK
jgi:hypothetical protein